MSMNLLEMIQEATAQMGLPPPDEVVGSTDQQVIQLYALTRQAARELARNRNWQALTRQHIFYTTATPDQTADPFPEDFDHSIPNTFFNRTTRRGMIGPITPQIWQAIQTLPAYATPYLMWRERDDKFLATPTPEENNEIAYEYVTTNYVVAANGDEKPQFTADTDTTLLSDELIVLSTKWRFLSAKGLDYSEQFRDYELELQRIAARDGGSGSLTITGSPTNSILNYPNLPLGSFPSN